MDRVRNGRVIIDNIVHDIMLHSNGGFVFDFSIYTRPYHTKNIICMDKETIGHTALEPEVQQNIPLLDKIVGFENYNESIIDPKKYELVQRDFDILSDVNLVYAHPDLDEILSQLNISSLTPFYMPEEFNLESTGEKVPVELMRTIGESPVGRTAAFEQPITLNGELYFLEVKGVNCGDMPIKLNSKYKHCGEYSKECMGGLIKQRMEHSVEILKHLNSNGYNDVILIAAYNIPELKQFYVRETGVYIRAVKCSPSISHYSKNLPEVAESLGWSKEELAEYTIRGATRDMAIMWKTGIVHNGPVHEQNIRIGSITDFTASRHVKNSGFKEVVYDTASFVFSCQNIMERLIGYKSNAPEVQAECYFEARKIITDELNNQLELNLPRKIGTASLAAEIYNLQRQLGLTNPNEKITVEYDMVHRARSEIGGILLQLFGKKPQETIKYLTMEDLLVH